MPPCGTFSATSSTATRSPKRRVRWVVAMAGGMGGLYATARRCFLLTGASRVITRSTDLLADHTNVIHGRIHVISGRIHVISRPIHVIPRREIGRASCRERVYISV